MNSHIHPTLQPFLWFAPPAQQRDEHEPQLTEEERADLAEDVEKGARRNAINEAEALRIEQQLNVWRNNGGM